MPKNKNKIDKSKAYAWVAYMCTHESAEIDRLLKYGTPSDRLIRLAETPTRLTLSDGKIKYITFPVSLNKTAGQKLIHSAAKRIRNYLQTIPSQAYELLEYVRANVTHRRKDTQSNLFLVAEAICHRAASEFKHEILFAFDSINTWINAAYGKELGYLTLRKCLELLQDAGIIRVVEWGVRGNRGRCTKLEILPQDQILTYTSKVDAWLDNYAHAMMKVYSRESTTRQDVLEERIHHYADQLADEATDGPAWAPVRGLFGADSDTMESAGADDAPMTLEEMLHEISTNRYLGTLVQSMRTHGPNSGGSNSYIRQRNTS